MRSQVPISTTTYAPVKEVFNQKLNGPKFETRKSDKS